MPIAAFDINQFAVTEIAGVAKKEEDVNWWTPFTYPFNLSGQPAATVPCGWDSDGLPLGLHIIGRPFGDATVLRAAAAFEKAAPWADKRPPLD
jgi:aspartyl-tRNA(Asn)/glutamyl-tRNA(Gln) amidotransferase subunit A